MDINELLISIILMQKKRSRNCSAIYLNWFHLKITQYIANPYKTATERGI